MPPQPQSHRFGSLLFEYYPPAYFYDITKFELKTWHAYTRKTSKSPLFYQLPMSYVWCRTMSLGCESPILYRSVFWVFCKDVVLEVLKQVHAAARRGCPLFHASNIHKVHRFQSPIALHKQLILAEWIFCHMPYPFKGELLAQRWGVRLHPWNIPLYLAQNWRGLSNFRNATKFASRCSYCFSKLEKPWPRRSQV